MSFTELCQKARLRMIRMHFESKVGHLGGNLSCLDALLYLHHYILTSDDIFILSKGHAAGALYITLWSTGRISDDQLGQFHRDGSKLAGHPVSGWIPEIAVATGSLGHGFPMSTGIALGKRLQKKHGRVYCLMSDGEWQEGSNWEALIFAHHQGLDNLTVIIDLNGLQGFGSTEEIASMTNLIDRIRAFGVDVIEIDGHNEAQLASIGNNQDNGPQFILMNTVKGKGISFMENRMEWHYLPLSQEQFELANRELGAV
nr:transketolase [uncultured Undibacterium sp.]